MSCDQLVKKWVYHLSPRLKYLLKNTTTILSPIVSTKCECYMAKSMPPIYSERVFVHVRDSYANYSQTSSESQNEFYNVYIWSSANDNWQGNNCLAPFYLAGQCSVFENINSMLFLSFESDLIIRRSANTNRIKQK